MAAKSGNVEISGVNVSYGDNHVLKNVDLSIRSGEFFAFLGPSGCGKTTLLRLIAGFNNATSGTLRLDDRDIIGLPPWQRDVGMVFQSYALWPHMSVRRNVAFGLEERRLPRVEIGQKVEAALSLVGLAELADRYPAQLSGGQQQRVALARTIAVEPKVLLLDEPLSNLDAQMRVTVRRELRELQQRLGITTIFVTHDQEEANAIADRMAVMKDGVIQQIGAPMDLYERPANLFVASFLGTANILSGSVVTDGAARWFEFSSGDRMPVEGEAAHGPSSLVFRPQHVALARTATAPHALKGQIASCEFLGAVVRYTVATPAGLVICELPFTGAGTLVAVSEPVYVAVPPGSLTLIRN